MTTAAETQHLLESGRAAEALGNIREAAVRYEAALKLAPENPLPFLLLGVLCHRMRDYPRARDLLQRAAQLTPQDPEVAFRLGLTCDALGDRESARAAHRLTMTLAPSSWQTWFLIGRDHRHLGHSEVARIAYRKALEASPEQPDVLSELGSLLWETGKHEDAFPYLERAARACPTDS
jgi:Flp pilus assembly protein TadD